MRIQGVSATIPYLEQNQSFLSEIARLPVLQISPKLAESRNVFFHSAGQYNSDLLNTHIFLGIKASRGRQGYDMKDRVATELAIMELISIHLPHLSAKLPVVHALIQTPDQETKPRYLLTEDFSAGNTKVVLPHPQINPKLEKFLDEERGVMVDLKHATFDIEGELRFDDFYEARFSKPEDKDLRKRILDEIEKYTLQLPVV